MMQLKNESLDTQSVLDALEKRLSSDLTFSSGHILGSMCSAPDPIAPTVFSSYLEKNIGDPGLFPATVDLEKEVIQTIGSMLGGREVSGSVLTGGTEANILAMWAAKRKAGASRRQVILPESAHFSFDKAADMMDLELIRIPLDKDHRVRVEGVAAAISDRTMAIVGVAGSTGLGTVDPLSELSELALEHDLFFHVDAAFGGFVLPFLAEAGYPAPPFGFSLAGISSITIDPHKMGRSALPAGCLIFRNAGFEEYTETKVTYLSGGETTQHTVTGTRSGASVASVWAVLQRHGRAGYVETVKRAMQTTHWLVEEVRKIPGVSVVVNPTVNIIGIATDRGNVKALVAELRARGWATSLFDGYLRVAVMPHLTPDLLRPFLSTLAEIAAH
jgi:tyrosine decarboxylase/aspartate 1-decarboxylase